MENNMTEMTHTSDVLRETARDAKSEVKDLAQQASQQAKQAAEQRKGTVAESISGVARALQSTATSLWIAAHAQRPRWTRPRCPFVVRRLVSPVGSLAVRGLSLRSSRRARSPAARRWYGSSPSCCSPLGRCSSSTLHPTCLLSGSVWRMLLMTSDGDSRR